MKNNIRPIAICIVRKNDSILVFEGYDQIKKETFYRPLGGAIEFGEHSKSAVCREFKEEIGSNLNNINYLAMLENIFIYKGKPHHELVTIYEGDLVEKSLYERKSFTGYEDDNSEFKVIWIPFEVFKAGETILYPDGLLCFLLDK